MFTIIFYLFLVFILIKFTTHSFAFVFLYIEHQLGRRKSPEQHPETAISKFIANCLYEFILVNLKYILYPIKFKNIDKNQNIKSHKAVLFIHGYGRHQADWRWFIKEFSKNNHIPIFAINLTPENAPIQQLAELLPSKIKEIQNITNADEIVLVGHSMGGLVAGYFIEYLQPDLDCVKKIITLGTPFYGTKIAVMSSAANIKQLIPDNSFLQELQSKISTSKRQYFNIATKIDNLVFPWSSCLLPNDSKRHYVYNGYSHLGMLYTKEIVKTIAAISSKA